jgi:hypothetical protein
VDIDIGDSEESVNWRVATKLDGKVFYPVSVYAYPDTVAFCLKRQLSKTDVEWLKRRCRLDYWWSHKLREHLLWIYYPVTHEVLAFMVYLMKHNPDVRQTQVHEALDWCFNSEAEVDKARRIFDTYNVWPHCRRVEYKKGTRYTTAKNGRNNLVAYHDPECRVTDEVYCLHIENRLKGARTLERHGITTAQDIIDLDRRQFWQDKLKMSTVDMQKLGIIHDNHFEKKARRKPNITRRLLSSGREFVYDQDSRIGHMINYGKSTQEVIIAMRKKGIDIQRHRCLKGIDVGHLLPACAEQKDESANGKLYQREGIDVSHLVAQAGAIWDEKYTKVQMATYTRERARAA